MSLAACFRSLGARLFHRSQTENDMAEEFRLHIQRRADDLERCGVDPVQAEHTARLEFGSSERFKEECREAFGSNLIDSLFRDVRYGGRMLLKNSGFTAMAVA
jgi:hypothetical protein